MRIVLRQAFPLGRFHATPWRMFPFDDPHGEWPPSPWRLLRAILARSHQLERERGISCRAWRESVVEAFCRSNISWSLPPFSWRGPGLRQYQPVEFGWDPPGRTKRVKGRKVEIPGKKTYRPTLVCDNFWVVGGSGSHGDPEDVWWIVDGEDWCADMLDWLDASLLRMTYLGRAEAITEMKRVERLPTGIQVNCVLDLEPSSDSVPVLVPAADATLEQVQQVTDHPSVRYSTVPPGARWLHATRPVKPQAQFPRSTKQVGRPTSVIQFAIGTRVSPTRRSIVVLTQRFRGRLIRRFLGESWQSANRAKRESVRLLAGKEANGAPLLEHQHPHARFGILFDRETGKATRFLVWRTQPFTDDEIRAILYAAEQELPLSFAKAGSRDPWAIRLIPLGSMVPVPSGFGEQTYRRWESVTPYVPARYVFNRRGRIKTGESLEEQLCFELSQQGFETRGLTVRVDYESFTWTRVHRPRRSREDPTNTERRGYCVSLTFHTPVRGPISLGHSSHFGLGLFVGVDD